MTSVTSPTFAVCHDESPFIDDFFDMIDSVQTSKESTTAQALRTLLQVLFPQAVAPMLVHTVSLDFNKTPLSF